VAVLGLNQIAFRSPDAAGFVVRDPAGRRLEFVHDDLEVFWREDE
jgi:hypothetical protein